MNALNLISLEILMINLFTTHLCVRKKYSNSFTFLCLGLSFAGVRFIGFLLNDLGNPGMMAVLRGCFFFIPLVLLYDEKWDRIMSVMVFSFTHSLLVNALSMELVFGFTGSAVDNLVVIVQSVIFLFSTFFVVRMIRGKFIVILRGLPARMEKLVILLGVIIFSCVLWIRFFLLQHVSVLSGVVTIGLLSSLVVSLYWLLFMIVQDSKSISSLRKLAYSDNLTGASNRLSLELDVDEMIASDEAFYLVYMDLDSFKSVNDRFGHDEGDRYLKSFAQGTMDAIGERGKFYRMSGDEFICLCRARNIESFLETLEVRIINSFYRQIPFLGVSIGYAKYPNDGDNVEALIRKADKVMYRMKKMKRQETS